MQLTPFPAWITQNVRSPKSLKLLFRCWLASWLAFVLLLPDKSLQTLGNAAFFSVLVSLMLPPNMPVQMFIFAIAMLYIGLLLGWAFGAAAMRASLAARDQVLLQHAFQKVQESAAGLSNPDALYRIDIFHGYFLDPRSTVVYGVFLGVCNFLFALLRAYIPKLMFMSLFATIGIDIFCSYAPLFPFAQYTLLNSVLISSAAYTGIACIMILLVFPETMAHSYLEGVESVLGICGSLVSVQEDVLCAGAGEDIPNETETKPGAKAQQEGLQAAKSKIDGLRAQAIGGLQQLDAKTMFVDLEFSYGKWNSKDVKALAEPLRLLTVRAISLQTLSRLLLRSQEKDSDVPRIPRTAETSESASTFEGASVRADHAAGLSANRDASPDTQLLLQLYSALNREAESKYSIRPEDILPLLREITGPLRQAIVDALAHTKGVVESVNRRRWALGEGKVKGQQSSEQDLVQATAALRRELEAFRGGKYKELVEPFAPLFEKTEGEEAASAQSAGLLPLRALNFAYVFSASLIATAEATLGLLDTVLGITKKRTRRRVWAPTGLRALGKLFTRRDGEGEGKTLGEDVDVGEGEEGEWEREARRDPDSRPPKNAFQRFMNFVHAVFQWTKSPEVMFAAKTVILTICLWLPQVIPRSAAFAYEQKSVWALIMAQMTLNVYASDQIFNYFTRLAGTLVGLVFGLLTWYIGSGSGNGNPYGIAASMGVFLVPTVFLRLFAPPATLSGVVTGTVTVALIVGYSWIDGHLPLYGNPGVGWSIAWRRWVLVVIGSAASFIIMMFPPKSGRKAVRLRNATTIKRIYNLYSLLISRWISGADGAESHVGTDGSLAGEKSVAPDSKSWSTFFRSDLVSIAEQLQALKSMTAIAKWEGNVRGSWPFEEYNRMVDVQIQMLGNLAQLGGALSHMSEEWRLAFLKRTRALNPNFITDVLSLFSLISQSLRTGEPLHEVLPSSLFERLAYHHHRTRKIRDAPIDAPQLEQLQSLDYMVYASGMIAVLELIVGLDELHAITRRLCGEVSLKGFGEWRNEYLRGMV
ncbi:hypothetical protein GLOTRDRAFT_66016 [Gloeophyllum trabeum ATCC 11539]|uniref:ER transporter 6TM N-terminal domain-containing protein n=1 Tax=Gloeophyllum trabeum (strain ATCC 11539 / FP-39264 / Madison 617) TaxID=670483 RepID=S7PTY2_GLOTA|nr:uncharacterized protein GLOTRDRAFT_66016 [Gloeophyllum trabeum ATCC 11539]EPQ51266.1 hypothetical protein GLOTRDRAFT_66016 [Gloeophyllum trabeum ATCC 11539]